ncbi:MAG: flagellar biosynthetic protein FliO [Oscillospiraceae bacterium]
MDFMKDVLPLLGSLAAIAAVLYLTYLFSKFMGTRVNEMGNKGNIKIVERVALGQDKGLAVAEINQKYYLLGISNNNISMLMEMDEYSPPNKIQQGKDFSEIFKANILKRSDGKAGGTNDKDS